MTEKMAAEKNAAWTDFCEIFTQIYSGEDKIIEARLVVADLVNKYNGYEKSYTEKSSKMKSILEEAFGEDKEMKKAFFIGYDKQTQSVEQTLKEYFSTEKEYLKNIDILLDFLYSRTYSIMDGEINFEKAGDSDKHAQLLDKLEVIEKHREIIDQKLNSFG